MAFSRCVSYEKMRKIMLKKSGNHDVSGSWKKTNIICIMVFAFVLTTTIPILANNIQVDNVTITEQNTIPDYHYIRLNIRWDNSRYTTSSVPYNWDAAWIFAKFRVGSGDWKHCSLATEGHIAPTGSTIEVGTTDGVGKGVFIYRSADGSGNVNWDNVKLQWKYTTDGVADDATVDVKVFAIEMVYIPQGTFCLYNGECDNIYSNFNSGNTISSEEYIPEGSITWSIESSWCGALTNNGEIGGCDELCAGYPKGYQAIYCMKYEISQGQYADFLSHLTETQSNNRYPNQNGNCQHTINDDFIGNYYALKSDRACNYLSWADGLAYADWAGLRPMTELEYEKICRGQKNKIRINIKKDEVESALLYSNNKNSYARIENLNNSNVRIIDCLYSEVSTLPDIVSSLPYYGVMMMNDNLSERCITVAKYCWNCCTWNNETHAGSFDGKHGDGYLTKTGLSNVSKWPSQEAVSGYSAYGSSIRGACWMYSPSKVPVSDRNLASYPYAGRIANAGFRAGRTAE